MVIHLFVMKFRGFERAIAVYAENIEDTETVLILVWIWDRAFRSKFIGRRKHIFFWPYNNNNNQWNPKVNAPLWVSRLD